MACMSEALLGAALSLENSHIARAMLLYFRTKTCIQIELSNITHIFIAYLIPDAEGFPQQSRGERRRIFDKFALFFDTPTRHFCFLRLPFSRFYADRKAGIGRKAIFLPLLNRHSLRFFLAHTVPIQKNTKTFLYSSAETICVA